MSFNSNAISDDQNNNSRQKILIVEDFQQSANFMSNTLRFCKNAACTNVSSGKEVIDLLTELKEPYFDLLLCDIHLPEISGIDAIRRIRSLESTRKWKPLMIIAMSADAENGQKALNAGASIFL